MGAKETQRKRIIFGLRLAFSARKYINEEKNDEWAIEEEECSLYGWNLINFAIETIYAKIIFDKKWGVP